MIINLSRLASPGKNMASGLFADPIKIISASGLTTQIPKITFELPFLGSIPIALYPDDPPAGGDDTGGGQDDDKSKPDDNKGNKSDGSSDDKPDYLDYEFGGLKYNKHAFKKAVDHGYQKAAKEIEKKILSGEHSIKPLTSDIQKKLEEANNFHKALDELKKGNELDPEKFNTRVVEELQMVKSREEKNLKLLEDRHLQEMQKAKEELGKLRSGVVFEAIASRLRPKLITDDNKNDKGMQIAFRAIVHDLAGQVELQENMDFRVFKDENGERVYLDKVVNGKSVPMTLDDLCEDMIKESPVFALAEDFKKGSGTKINKGQPGKGEENLFSWQTKRQNSDFQPRSAN